eukprot:Gb_41785 [translate_table: standard]
MSEFCVTINGSVCVNAAIWKSWRSQMPSKSMRLTGDSSSNILISTMVTRYADNQGNLCDKLLGLARAIRSSEDGDEIGKRMDERRSSGDQSCKNCKVCGLSWGHGGRINLLPT